MGRLDGKVALISGIARGQGRSHAVRLAEEGADIVGFDALSDVATVGYPLARREDLDETVELVEKLDRRIVVEQADVRDQAAVSAVVETGWAALGRIDIVVANAGIASFAPAWELTDRTWADMIDINLTGVWHTVKAVVPRMIQQGQGGVIVAISSVAGLKGLANIAHYCSAKHGLVGLMRTLALELGPHGIRVNTVHPTNVATDMILNEATFKAFRPDIEHPAAADIVETATAMHALPIPWVESIDISNAVLWLASDEARYVTGVALPVDAGLTAK